jgi:hypothetical protein
MQILLADYGRASHHCKDPEILGRHYGPAKAACSNCQMFATLPPNISSVAVAPHENPN